MTETETGTFVHEHRVGFDDVDAAGIVYFPRILDYCHRAFEELLVALGRPLYETLRDGPHAAPVVHAEADYRSPLVHGDPVRIEIRIAEIGARSFQVAYVVRSGERLVAEARIVHVTLDRPSCAPVEVPKDLRAALEPYLVSRPATHT